MLGVGGVQSTLELELEPEPSKENIFRDQNPAEKTSLDEGSLQLFREDNREDGYKAQLSVS